MPLSRIANHARPLIIFGGTALIIGTILLLFDMRTAIIFLNAIFIGSMIGICFAYAPLIWAVTFGKPPFNRAQQYALGVFYWGLALMLGALSSIYIYSSDLPTNSLMAVAAARQFAIIGAWLQVTAPGFGNGFFAGIERKVLWSAVIISFIIAFILLSLQLR